MAARDRTPNPSVLLGGILGSGAFGRVYKGHHLALAVDVAVKFVDVEDADGEDALDEARLMARLDHPNVLRIFDARLDGTTLCLVLEFMDDNCGRLRQIDALQAEDLLRQLLSGLQALHAAGILHRDIKPENCLLRRSDWRVKLADLGIAVDQKAGGAPQDASGTLPFMAPEILMPVPRFSEASDLYALGLTMQCMMLARSPYPRTEEELYTWILQGPRTPIGTLRPDISAEFASFIDRLSDPKVEQRPPSATAALARLDRLSLWAGVAADEPALHDSERSTVKKPYGRRVSKWVVGPEIEFKGIWHTHAATNLEDGLPARVLLSDVLEPFDPNEKPLFSSPQWEKHLADRHTAQFLIQKELGAATKVAFLSHPAVSIPLGSGIEHGTAFIATPPEGHSLHTLMLSAGNLSELDVAHFAMSVAGGLDYLHQAGLLYHIVEPRFVVIGADAKTARLSWPKACQTLQESNEIPFKWSPKTVAPEVLARIYVPSVAARIYVPSVAPPIGFAADIYSLGETMFISLAGRLSWTETPDGPWNDGGYSEKVKGSRDIRELVPSVSPEMARVLASMLSVQPTQRPTAAEVRRELAGIADAANLRDKTVRREPKNAAAPRWMTGGWRIDS